MIRSARNRHRVTFLILAVVLPVLLVLGLLSRQTMPTVDSLPGQVPPAASAEGGN